MCVCDLEVSIKWWYPKNHPNLHRIFPYKPSIFGGIPMTMKPPYNQSMIPHISPPR